MELLGVLAVENVSWTRVSGRRHEADSPRSTPRRRQALEQRRLEELADHHFNDKQRRRWITTWRRQLQHTEVSFTSRGSGARRAVLTLSTASRPSPSPPTPTSAIATARPSSLT